MRRIVTHIKIATHEEVAGQVWSCRFGDERWSCAMIGGYHSGWDRRSNVTGEWVSVRESNVPDEVLAAWALTQ